MKSDSNIKKVATPKLNGSPKPEKADVGSMSSYDSAPPKTSGIRVRGGKAQTKGFMARGPMA